MPWCQTEDFGWGISDRSDMGIGEGLVKWKILGGDQSKWHYSEPWNMLSPKPARFLKG